MDGGRLSRHPHLSWLGFRAGGTAADAPLAVELGGVGLPDWHEDQGVFDPRTLGQMVDWIDAHLHDTPTPLDLGMLTVLAPQPRRPKVPPDDGVSLARFVNRRRLQAAIRQLATTDVPLATLTQELGFPSQSHFTRQFSRLTGMPPGRYRRQLRPTAG
jgi:AraC-like DNA-binding protein